MMREYPSNLKEAVFGRRSMTSHGRGAYGKMVIFGIFKQDNQVYTGTVPNYSKPTLQGIIRSRVDPRPLLIPIGSVAKIVFLRKYIPGGGYQLGIYPVDFAFSHGHGGMIGHTLFNNTGCIL